MTVAGLVRRDETNDATLPQEPEIKSARRVPGFAGRDPATITWVNRGEAT